MLEYLVVPVTPNFLYLLSENTFQLGLLFGSCGILSETNRNKEISSCLKLNLKIASNFMIMSALLNLYRINRR